MIKDIVKKLKPSATLQINEETKRLQNQGKKVYKFGFGQSPFPVPNEVRNELINNAHQNKYLPMQGLTELRESVAIYLNKKNKNKFKADDIIIGPGTKELIMKIKKQIKKNASPRHVPYKIFPIKDIPKTKNGKIVELAVKQTIEGDQIKNLEALVNPDSLNQFKNIKELYE